MKVAVLDYDCGNINSVSNMLSYIGVEGTIAMSKSDIECADSLIIPGVGHFQKGMESLRKKDFLEPLADFKESGKPILGICLGMQLLTQGSEEAQCDGLGWISGYCKKIPGENNGKRRIVPHMGWNTIDIANSPKKHLFRGSERFYFVHSYAAEGVNAGNVLTETVYEEFHFVSGIHKENVVGVQFHPEKSHKNGLAFFSSYFDVNKELYAT